MWNKTIDKVSAQAVSNLEREFSGRVSLEAYSTDGILERTLKMHRVHGRTSAEDYAAGFILSGKLMSSAYQVLGSYYIYLFRSSEVCLVKADDMQGGDVRTPYYWDHCWPPKTGGPILKYSGGEPERISYGQGLPIKKWPMPDLFTEIRRRKLFQPFFMKSCKLYIRQNYSPGGGA